MTELHSAMDAPLKAIEANIVIDGIVARARLKQEFKNQTDNIIEAAYQFPLPNDAVVMLFHITINGKRYEGMVQGKSEATDNYEEGIASGKRSFLLESLGDGLYQVNAGNLAPNETVFIELEIASLISRKNELWQYCLPTVIAPKYGQSSLADESLPETSLFSDYDLTGTIKINGASSIEAANTKLQAEEDLWRFSSKLDRTFMFNWRSELVPNTLYTAQSPIDDLYYGVALLESQPKEITRPEYANLQLLIDCSGSMMGRSISEARTGVLDAIAHLTEGDKVNVIKFGSRHDQLFSSLKPFTGKTQAKINKYIEQIDADMGGTELFTALSAAVDATIKGGGGDIVLVTDANVWNQESELMAISKKANQAGVRVFGIGVGSGVDGSLLENISRESGGNTLLLDPHCNMAVQIENLIDQLRSPKTGVDIGENNLEWSHLPNTIFNRSTVPSFFYSQNLNSVKIDCIDAEQKREQATLDYITADEKTSQCLIKLVALKRLAKLDHAAATQLATEHQIVSEYTSYVFVDTETVEGSDGLPEFKKVPQMVSHSAFQNRSLKSELQPSVSLASPSPVSAQADFLEAPKAKKLARMRKQPNVLPDEEVSDLGFLDTTSFDESVGIIESLLNQANIDFDRTKNMSKQSVQLAWLTTVGISLELIERLNAKKHDETELLAALLYWLDEKHQILSARVKAWCRVSSSNIHNDPKLKRTSLKLLKDEGLLG